MIDTHAHLARRFKQEGDLGRLTGVVLAASSEEDSVDNLELAKSDKKLWPAVGIHPQEVKENIGEQIKFLEELLRNNTNIVAVGECGLELLEGADKNKQEELFRGQIELAVKYQKPLIVHSRKASEETIEILKSYKNLSGVIHCYSGGKKRIQKILELGKPPTASQSWRSGWYFGIDGNVTYEIGLAEVVAAMPKDRLVLETDCPFLTPAPFRGQKNKPEYVEYVYKKVAEIWGKSFEETEKMVDENAKGLFSLYKNHI